MISPTDFIVIAVLLLIVGAAAFYIIRSKRKGRKCIGCPWCDTCSKKNCEK